MSVSTSLEMQSLDDMMAANPKDFDFSDILQQAQDEMAPTMTLATALGQPDKKDYITKTFDVEDEETGEVYPKTVTFVPRPLKLKQQLKLIELAEQASAVTTDKDGMLFTVKMACRFLRVKTETGSRLATDEDILEAFDFNELQEAITKFTGMKQSAEDPNA